MKDKHLTLEKVRKKAEEECASIHFLVYRYMLLTTGLGCVCVFGYMYVWNKVSLLSILFLSFFVVPGSALFALLFWIRVLAWRHARPQLIIEILKKEPQNADDYLNRSAVCYVYNFYEAAVEECRTACGIEPDNDLALFSLAECLWLLLHQGDEALAIAEKLAKKEGSQQASALALLGAILTKKNPIEALKCFDKAIEIEPNSINVHLALLRFLIDTDQLDRAAEAVTETVKLLKRLNLGQAHYKELLELQGVLAMKQGRFADAVKALTLAIRQSPAEAKYYQLRSDAHEALGNIDKAEKDRRKVQTLTETQS